MTTNIAPLSLQQIQSLYEKHGAMVYGEEAISQLEHALQGAYLAEQANETPAMIIATLLHDVGHLLIEESLTEDRRHQEVAIPYLATLGPAVCEPIRLHVAAKRYLCATDSAYWASLSPASQRTLLLQGGIFSTEEATEFIAQPYASDAVRLRQYDDLAKDPQATTPDFQHFTRYWQAIL